MPTSVRSVDYEQSITENIRAICISASVIEKEKKLSTSDQSVVEQCMTLFECHHVQETIRERKRKRLQKFRMSSNQLCVTFREKASADLELQ